MAVHERRLSLVPRLATPPPRFRRYPPPYLCSQQPTSMALRRQRQRRQLTSQTRRSWCSDCERRGRRHGGAHVSAEFLALDQNSARTHAVPAARALLTKLDGLRQEEKTTPIIRTSVACRAAWRRGGGFPLTPEQLRGGNYGGDSESSRRPRTLRNPWLHRGSTRRPCAVARRLRRLRTGVTAGRCRLLPPRLSKESAPQAVSSSSAAAAELRHRAPGIGLSETMTKPASLRPYQIRAARVPWNGHQ